MTDHGENERFLANLAMATMAYVIARGNEEKSKLELPFGEDPILLTANAAAAVAEESRNAPPESGEQYRLVSTAIVAEAPPDRGGEWRTASAGDAKESRKFVEEKLGEGTLALFAVTLIFGIRGQAIVLISLRNPGDRVRTFLVQASSLRTLAEVLVSLPDNWEDEEAEKVYLAPGADPALQMVIAAKVIEVLTESCRGIPALSKAMAISMKNPEDEPVFLSGELTVDGDTPFPGAYLAGDEKLPGGAENIVSLVGDPKGNIH